MRPVPSTTALWLRASFGSVGAQEQQRERVSMRLDGAYLRTVKVVDGEEFDLITDENSRCGLPRWQHTLIFALDRGRSSASAVRPTLGGAASLSSMSTSM